MTRTEARRILEKFIKDERVMRERVFAQKPATRKHKVEQCDRALEALDVLEPPPVKPTELLPPRTLFDVD